MKRFPILAVTAVVAVVVLFSTEAFSQKKTKKPCAPSLKKCPDEGCGKGSDPLLNLSKNKKESPDETDVADMTLTQIKALSQKLPSGWKEGDARDTFTGPNKEGKPVRVMAWLWKSRREKGESCNCGLDAKGTKGEKITDIHMVLTPYQNSDESASITAEITPRVRALRPKPITWTYKRIRKNDNKYIRVTGWLMLDTHHLVATPLTRATNWEVHPITKFEVCTLTATKCRTTGEGWVEVP